MTECQPLTSKCPCEDWSDYKSCLPSVRISELDQQIGMGDGTTTNFALVKAYGSGPETYLRRIVKPVANTIRVALNGAEQFTGWAADVTTGIVSFDAAPDAGVTITAGFEFDTPVRFDADMLDVTLDLERLGSITAIPLIEVRIA